MEPRMTHPVSVLPDALTALLNVSKAIKAAGLDDTTALLVELRASQLNGCSVCVDMHARDLRKNGESDERLFGVAAWRESPYFTDAERAALALTEAATRLADSDGVPDAIWDEAARHFDEAGLAQIVLNIALSNFFNRLNATTRQIAGSVRWEG